MQQLFIELYNYRKAWHELPSAQKNSFADGVLMALAGLGEHGVEVIGWGMNDPATDRRAGYDFFCAYKVPSVEFQRAFEANIEASNWHDYFEQVNVSGALMSPSEVLTANIDLRHPQKKAAA